MRLAGVIVGLAHHTLISVNETSLMAGIRFQLNRIDTVQFATGQNVIREIHFKPFKIFLTLSHWPLCLLSQTQEHTETIKRLSCSCVQQLRFKCSRPTWCSSADINNHRLRRPIILHPIISMSFQLSSL